MKNGVVSDAVTLNHYTQGRWHTSEYSDYRHCLRFADLGWYQQLTTISCYYH